MPAGGAHILMRSWSPEEDQLLLSLFEEQGPRWKHIASTLGDVQNRTPAMVRNRYLRILKGRKRASEGLSRNKCGRCGQLKQGHVCTAVTNVSPSLTLQQQAHAAMRGEPSASQVLAPTAVTTPPLALAEVAEVSVPTGGLTMPAGGLVLGAPPMLTCVENKDANGNEMPTNPPSTNPLFAPMMSWSIPDGKDESGVCKDLPIASSCIWSPATSPDAAATPDGMINAASLLAPTPEGMQGMYTFPLSRVEA